MTTAIGTGEVTRLAHCRHARKQNKITPHDIPFESRDDDGEKTEVSLTPLQGGMWVRKIVHGMG
jgi:hypothetical protein